MTMPTLSDEMTEVIRQLYDEARTTLIGPGDEMVLPPGVDRASYLLGQQGPLDYLLRGYGYDPIGGEK